MGGQRTAETPTDESQTKDESYRALTDASKFDQTGTDKMHALCCGPDGPDATTPQSTRSDTDENFRLFLPLFGGQNTSRLNKE